MERQNHTSRTVYTSSLNHTASHGGALPGAPKEAIRSKLSYNPIDIASAKFIAKELFGTYDSNRSGAIEGSEAKSMIIDAYTNINKLSIPKDGDVQHYLEIHDQDRDGRLTLQDMEQICMKYLCSSTLSGGVNLLDDVLGYTAENRTQSSASKLHTTTTTVHHTTTSQASKPLGTKTSVVKSSTSGYLWPVSSKEQLRTELVTVYGYDNERIESDLRHARSVFEKYDANKDGSLDAREIRRIMQDTYESLGMKFDPTDADVHKYIEMMDKNSDGKISLPEYEVFVLNSLKKRHIHL